MVIDILKKGVLLPTITLVTTFATLLSCCADNLNDYGVDLGDGYILFYANSIDVSIIKAKPTGQITFKCPKSENTGPIAKYVNSPKYILAIRYGLNYDDELSPEIDPKRQAYYIIVKKTEEIIGPLKKEEFEERPEVKSVGMLKWETAKEEFWYSLLKSIVFLPGLFLLIPILAIKYYWITIPFVIVAFLIIKRKNIFQRNSTYESSD